MEAMDEDGPWPRVGAHQNSSHILLDGALAPRRGRVKGQTIYSLTWPLPREGAYQLSNHILLDGALASRGGISKVKPYTSRRGPGPGRGRIKSQTIYSLTGPWPREGGVSKVELWIKDTPKPRGPVYKFEMRPRIFMDSYINMKEGQ